MFYISCDTWLLEEQQKALEMDLWQRVAEALTLTKYMEETNKGNMDIKTIIEDGQEKKLIGVRRLSLIHISTLHHRIHLCKPPH